MSKKRSTTDIKPNSLLVRGQSQTPSSLSLRCRGLLTAASRKVHIYPPPPPPPPPPVFLPFIKPGLRLPFYPNHLFSFQRLLQD